MISSFEITMQQQAGVLRLIVTRSLQGAEYPALADVKEKHPELRSMTSTKYRKHLRTITNTADRAKARELRMQQVQAKENIINEHYRQQRQAKMTTSKQNAISKYTDGKALLVVNIVWEVSGDSKHKGCYSFGALSLQKVEACF